MGNSFIFWEDKKPGGEVEEVKAHIFAYFCIMRCIAIVLCFIAIQLNAQLDSLKSIVVFSSVEEEIITYCDIAYLAHREDIPTSKEYGQKAIDLARSIGNDTLLAKSFQDAGYVYLSNSQPEIYLEYSQKALEIYESYNDSLKVAKARSNVALAYQEQGKLQEAMLSYKKALPYFIQNNQDYYVAVLKNNIGNLLHQTGQLEESAKYISESADALLAMGDTANFLIASANAASSLDKVGKHQAARLMYEEAYHYPFTGSLSAKTEAMRGLGVIEEREGNYADAKRYFTELLGVYDDLNAEGSRGFALARLGRAELELGDYIAAEEHILAAVPYYENSSSWEDLKHLQTQVARLFEIKGDYQKAFEAQSLVRIYNDSMLSINSQTEIIELEKQLELVEKDQQLLEKDISLKDEQNQSLRKSRWIIALCALAAIGFIVVLWWRKQKNLKQANQLKETELKAQQEKLRISRDLHDHIGAELTLIKSKVDVMAYSTEEASRKQELEKLSNYSKKAIDELRKTIWATQSEEVALDDFAFELRLFLQRYFDKNEVHVLNGNEKLNSNVALGAYRICQEAIQNAYKYAEGDEVKVNLSIQNSTMKCLIQDNGKGFDTTNDSFGYGLNNMKSRANELGGEFTLESTANGTRIDFTLPQ